MLHEPVVMRKRIIHIAYLFNICASACLPVGVLVKCYFGDCTPCKS